MIKYLIFLAIYFALTTGIGQGTAAAISDKLVARLLAIIVASFIMGLAGKLYFGPELGQIKILFAAIGLGIYHYIMFSIFTSPPSLLTVAMLFIIVYPVFAFFSLEIGLIVGFIVGKFIR